MKDAAATGGWLGFGNRSVYLRDGLGFDPASVDWAVEEQIIYVVASRA